MNPGDRINIQERHSGRSTTATVISVDGSTAVVDVGVAGWQPLENPQGHGASFTRRYCRIDVATASVVEVLERLP